jgi:hypothetical protein
VKLVDAFAIVTGRWQMDAPLPGSMKMIRKTPDMIQIKATAQMSTFNLTEVSASAA